MLIGKKRLERILRHSVEQNIKRELSVFIGETNTDQTRMAIIDRTQHVVSGIVQSVGVRVPLPKVVVEVHCSQCNVSLIDPNTQEKIEFGTWAVRLCEGDYD